jgi:hypothetical protein
LNDERCQHIGVPETMTKVVSFLFIAIGLLNLFPVIGVISAEQVNSLYGIDVDSADLETLMRHRAVMLGLVGALLILAAFRPSFQILAATMGLVSMSSFVVLAYFVGDVGAAINRVAVADIVGSVAAVVILVLLIRQRP